MLKNKDKDIKAIKPVTVIGRKTNIFYIINQVLQIFFFFLINAVSC